MRLLQILVLATTMLVSTNSAGFCGWVSGDRLLELCSGDLSLINTTDPRAQQILANSQYCAGYFMPIVDASECGNTVNGYSFMLPPNSNADQYRRVVLKYLNEHPEQLHFSAAGLVAKALSEAFPCK